MIGKFIDYIGFEKLFNYLIEIADVYFKPKKFFERFDRKPIQEKLTQTIFYSILMIGIGYVLTSDNTIKNLVKGLIYETAALLWIILVLLISETIISKLKEKKPRYQLMIFFPIIIKLLIAPLQLVFFGLFVSYENYNYFLISNLIILGITLYVIVGSAYIFHYKKRYIIVCIFLNFLIINLGHFLITTLSLDHYSTYEYPFVDVILKERIEKGEKLVEFYTIPSHRVLQVYNDNNSKVFYLLTSPFDSIASGNVDRFIEYKLNVRKNLKILDTMDLKYRRNQEFYDIVDNLYKAVDSITENKMVIDLNKIDTNDIAEASIIIDKDSTELYKEYVLELPENIFTLNYRVLENEMEIEKLSSNSASPFRILDFLYPFAQYYKHEKRTLTSVTSKYRAVW